jgi:hypothetical protein
MRFQPQVTGCRSGPGQGMIVNNSLYQFDVSADLIIRLGD